MANSTETVIGYDFQNAPQVSSGWLFVCLFFYIFYVKLFRPYRFCFLHGFSALVCLIFGIRFAQSFILEPFTSMEPGLNPTSDRSLSYGLDFQLNSFKTSLLTHLMVIAYKKGTVQFVCLGFLLIVNLFLRLERLLVR